MLYTICLSMQLYKLWIVIYLYLLILVLGFIHLPSQRTTLTSCFPHSLKTCKRIEWNDDGDSGGGGGGWRNGAMGRQHITLEAHRSRISLLPCTFAAPRVALCATVRSFTDLANYEALTQIFLMTFLQQFFFHNRVILFNWELVVLHSSPRMFGEFSVHAWKCGVSEWRTYYIASLRVKLILACSEEVLKWGYSSFRFKHYLRACTITSGKVLLVSHAKQPMENHRGPNPCKSSHLSWSITLIFFKTVTQNWLQCPCLNS